MAEQETPKGEIKKPVTPKFGRPRIVVPQDKKDAARSNMAGEAMNKNATAIPEPAQPAVETPATPGSQLAPPEPPAPAPENEAPAPQAAPLTSGTTRSAGAVGKKKRGSASKQPQGTGDQPEETKNVRLKCSLWLDAKHNLVQLSGTNAPQNLTDYTEEAFRLYEKHLLKTGSITRTRTGE